MIQVLKRASFAQKMQKQSKELIKHPAFELVLYVTSENSELK